MIGIDIIASDRFAKIRRDDYTHWSKFFTTDEWQYCFSRPGPAATLAGIYAAKEAVMKAVRGDLLERVDRIEIIHSLDGQPRVNTDKKNRPDIHVSISHTKDTAVAVAIVYER